MSSTNSLDPIEQEQRFNTLKATLVEQITAQLSTSSELAEAIIEKKFAGEQNSYAWMWNDSPSEEEQEQEKLFELEQHLNEKGLVLEGADFPSVNESFEWDYRALLTCIPKIYFVRCHFYNDGLPDASGAYISFSECTFYADWRISEAQAAGDIGPLFDQCCFKQKVELTPDERGMSPLMGYTSVFSGCELNELVLDGVTLDIPLFPPLAEKGMRLARLELKNCTLQQKLMIHNLKGVKSITFVSTVFENKFAMLRCQCEKFFAEDTNFNGLTDFYKTRFDDFQMEKSIFREFAGFEKCTFGLVGAVSKSPVTLRYVTFYSFINFRAAYFNQALDLRDTNSQQQPNFLDAEFSDTAKKTTDRETFRIIKHSFDAVGNRIEAHKYFAYEMQAYRRELKASKAKKKPGNRRERILLALNAAISSHGQDYGKALAWLLAAVAINAVVLANHQYQWWLLPEPIQNFLWNIAAVANGFANGFLPLRSLLGDELQPLAFWVLIAMVIISTLTWHVLVAIRRHARR